MLLYERKIDRKGEVNMDEMKLKLSTKFMKSIVSKLIARAIYKKYGYKVNIHITDLDFWCLDGDTTIKTNVEATMSSDEFAKLMKSINLD